MGCDVTSILVGHLQNIFSQLSFWEELNIVSHKLPYKMRYVQGLSLSLSTTLPSAQECHNHHTYYSDLAIWLWAAGPGAIPLRKQVIHIFGLWLTHSKILLVPCISEYKLFPVSN